ncbi:MAG: ABC transporter permease [Cellulomonas sp. 73-145]|uniref:carbohydrate ABC transporter permease n=1 Tax=Cellulomonas sp. 73-145 TaxID=1895739 RepID=UPI0009286751|nr:sugar ABC transporter permease [Cellulomonas sp. 73-145]OJV56713.1 MAG: ABC transporter permease [Cellulomonas sp. 73-145]
MKWLSTRRALALMIAPALAVYSLYFAYPIVYSLYQSFTNAQAFGSTTLVGAKNYTQMVHDTLFWGSLRNTGIILLVALVILLPGAFFLAHLLSGHVRGGGALRAMIFAPNVIAPILIGLIWVFILDPHIGLVNSLLRTLGVAHPPVWIGGTSLSPWSIGVVYTWQTVGFIMTIFYAGIRMLPHDVMEAASLDGATGWQRLRYVTVPMLQETFGITTVLVVTGVFKIFELVFQLTGGGPVHLSETLVSYTYWMTFSNQKYGYGMALAVVISLLGVVVTVAQMAFMRRRRAS